MSLKQKKFLLLLCAYIFAVCLGYSIYASAQIGALEENIAKLVEKAAELREKVEDER